MSLLDPRTHYKPFEYPRFFEYFQLQNQAHWLPTEVPMEADISDFRHRLTDAERSLVTNILRFFTQGDIEVNNNYNQHLIPAFPKPEVKMMLSAFAATEGIHVWAYSYLSDSLGLPESEYKAFLDHKEMREKYEYLHAPRSLAENLATFGGFMEGVSLFSSFAVLMNFPRLGKLRGLGQIIEWSMRDETLHSKGVCELFRVLVQEDPGLLDRPINPVTDRWTVRGNLKHACMDMVDLEDAFIDLCFSGGPVEGLAADEVKGYIRFLADRRLTDLGLTPIYGVANPLPWLDTMTTARSHTNFFENRSTDYAKGMVTNDWT